MKITFLGTGTSQGVPMIGCDCEACLSSDLKDKRLRSSVLVEHNGTRVLIDAGPDFRQQMLRESIHSVDAILITHEHRDHIGGIDDVRSFNRVLNGPVALYAEPRVLDFIKSSFSYVFAEKKYPGIPELSVHTIGVEPFTVGNCTIQPIRALHYMLPVLGFRFGNFAYLTDFNSLPESSMALLTNVEVLVVGALRHTDHISHFSLNEALGFIQKVKPQRAYLTHISDQMGKYADLLPLLPSNVLPAYDGLIIDC